MAENFDIVVVGAGIAGASAAAELAGSAHVALLDMEGQPGFHSTGRSAAFFAPAYGSAVVRGITAASEHFYHNPPADFSETELICARDAVFIARADQLLQLNEMGRDIPSLQKLSPDEVCERVPLLDRSYVAGALSDSSGGDLDVDAILQGYLRLFRKHGGQLMCNNKVEALSFSDGVWTVKSGEHSVAAPVLVNAAGAWADDVAELAGVARLGLQPMRRTAVLIDPLSSHTQNQSLNDQKPIDISQWPLVVDIDEQFYFKPDAGQLLVSPADETPSMPCDAHPEELDIAIAIDRLQKATTMKVQRVNHSWAGLRTFAPDRNFVVGFDSDAEGFFWLAGQGGYGVQAAPGLAQLSNALITQASLSSEFQAVLNFCKEVAPGRAWNSRGH